MLVSAAHPVALMSESEQPVKFAAELALARRVASGDRGASEAFARRLFAHVRRVSHALLSDREDAQDATQLSLLAILKAASNYRGTGTLEGWARRIATRTTLRWVRGQRAQRDKLRNHDDPSEARAASLRSTMIDELPRPLEHYLEELPDVQRTALLLRHSLGHTIPEISELTDAPVPTVKSRLQKAQLEMRRMIRRDLNLGVMRKADTP